MRARGDGRKAAQIHSAVAVSLTRCEISYAERKFTLRSKRRILRAVTRRERIFHFMAGTILSAIGFSIAGLAAVLYVGPPRVWNALGFASTEDFALPVAVRNELTAVRAVGDNFDSLQPEPHNTFFVQPDPILGYRLRPGAAADVTVLAPTRSRGLDPPTIAVPADVSLSVETRNFLNQNGRLTVRYTTTADGLRRTVPEVSADRQVVIVGDSVAFGVGVSDGDTVASQLQQALGPSTQLLNAAVPGYDGEAAATVADQLSHTRRFAALVYVACQNDFAELHGSQTGGAEWEERARRTLTRFSGVRARFDSFIMILTTAIDYEARHVLLNSDWDRRLTMTTDEMRAALPAMARSAGFDYLDWSTTVQAYVTAQRTVFAPFALYADAMHLSPLGHRLLAAQLAEALTEHTPAETQARQRR